MSTLSSWEKQGFASQPEKRISKGGERLVRAHSQRKIHDPSGERHGSFETGNCFFVMTKDVVGEMLNAPSDADLDSLNADKLEKNLNAGLWNNTYQNLTVFSMEPEIAYLIGPVGHAIRTDEKTSARNPGSAVEPVNGVAAMNASDPYLRDCLQVVLENAADVGRLTPVGAPRKVRDGERYQGARSSAWH